MTENSPGARAVSAVEISDVFLVESSCHIARDFNQMQTIPRVTFQHRLSPEGEGIAQVRKDLESGDEITVIRYFIDGGLRVLRPDATGGDLPPGEVDPKDILAEIAVKLAVDYICPKALLEDTDAIGAFSKNAVFHSWSYWRSVIHSLSDQMRLPRITLPMLRQHTIGPMQPFMDFSVTVADQSSNGNTLVSYGAPRVELRPDSVRPNLGRSRLSAAGKAAPSKKSSDHALPPTRAGRLENGGPGARRKK
jgi:hypothetical protein